MEETDGEDALTIMEITGGSRAPQWQGRGLREDMRSLQAAV